jgi:FMN reductase
MLSDNTRVRVVGLGGTLGRNSINLWALEHALRAAEAAGARIDLLSLNDMNLPIFQPDLKYEDLGPNIHHLIETVRKADAMIWSTAVYHGTLAGVTKNALDYLEYTRTDKERPYLTNAIIGLIATAGGETGSGNAINAMMHIVQSMHGIMVPRTVGIERAGKAWDRDGNLLDTSIGDRLDMLGNLVIDTACRLHGKEIFPQDTAAFEDFSW